MNENTIKFLENLKEYIFTEAGVDVSKNDRRHLVTAYRSVFFKIACKYTHLSLQAIGGYLGKNHATVIHSNNNIFDNLKYNWPRVLEFYEKIDNEIMSNTFPTTSNYMYYKMWMDEKISKESMEERLKLMEEKYYKESSQKRELSDNFYKLKQQLQRDGYDIQKYQRNFSTVS